MQWQQRPSASRCLETQERAPGAERSQETAERGTEARAQGRERHLPKIGWLGGLETETEIEREPGEKKRLRRTPREDQAEARHSVAKGQDDGSETKGKGLSYPGEQKQKRPMEVASHGQETAQHGRPEQHPGDLQSWARSGCPRWRPRPREDSQRRGWRPRPRPRDEAHR
jgi:hypothetical protein